MRSIRTRTVALATAATLSMALAACGSDDADPAADETSAEEMTSEMDSGMASEDEMSDDAMASEPEGESALTMQPEGPACDQIPAEGDASSEGMADDPVATAASANPLLSTLVEAVTEAELVETLNGLEAGTVFAPINSAFEAIPEEDMQAVMSDQETLTNILTLHVNGEEQLDLEALGTSGTVTTVNGADIEVDAENMTVTSPDGTEANIVCGNVQTANATVHLIDTVLMPAS